MVEARFGADFAASVFGTDPDRWSGPMASPYGYHLVYVTRRAPARVPDFAEVAGRIATDLDVARRAGALDRIYDQVRDAYQVEIEPAPADQPPHPPHLHDHAERTRA
jgi:peptidyl-prolyl cis-trans isomerase C